MDTKLKSTESKGKAARAEYAPSAVPNSFKALAFFLALLFSFLSGFELLQAVRADALYYSKNGLLCETPEFMYEFDSCMANLTLNYTKFDENSQTQDFDTFCKKNSKALQIAAELEQEKKDAVLVYDTIMRLKTLEPGESTNSTAVSGAGENNEDVYETEETENDYGDDTIWTTAADLKSYRGFDHSVLKIKKSYSSHKDWENDYLALREVLFSMVSNATSANAVTLELENRKQSALQSEYNDAADRSGNSYLLLSSQKNLQFLVVDNKTGEVYDNFSSTGLTPKEFIAGINQNSTYSLVWEKGALKQGKVKVDDSEPFLHFLYETGILHNKEISNDYVESYFNNIPSDHSVYIKIPGTIQRGSIFYSMNETFGKIKTQKTSSLFLAAALFTLLSAAAFVWLCTCSGKRKDGKIKLVPTDHVPLLFHAAAFFGALAAICASVWALRGFDGAIIGENLGTDISYYIQPGSFRVLIGFSFAAIEAALLSFVLYIIRNVRAHTMPKRFVTVLFIGSLKKAFSLFFKVKRKSRLLLIGFFAINALLVLFSLLAGGGGFEFFLILLLLFDGFAFFYTLRYARDIEKLCDFASQIRGGNLDPQINPKSFVLPLQKIASDLSDCRDSIEKAVAEAMKGERMRTELITNVSHDLKTPLTSIINYVSLLKLEKTTPEEAKNYLDVLEEKSKKLQRLIEDLTEASKATTGNIKMNPGPVNLNELALQAVGENSDMLESVGLELELNEHEEHIIVLADSQHTCRVLDNLFSNAKKYALKGTRVYVDIYREGNRGVFSVKNVSREKLNIDPEELKARFVRGDNSRTTDGSGLGLSIAQSFTELQGGEFKIEIDGDLFKAVILLPLAPETEEPENIPQTLARDLNES